MDKGTKHSDADGASDAEAASRHSGQKQSGTRRRGDVTKTPGRTQRRQRGRASPRVRRGAQGGNQRGHAGQFAAGQR